MAWTDWPPEVTDAATRGARDAHRHLRGVTTLDDLAQEALLYLSEQSAEVARYAGQSGPGGVRVLVRHRLLDRYRGEPRHAPLEENHDSGPAYVPQRTGDRYDREKIESLLALMWDPDWTAGPSREYAPDGDMPRGTADPTRGPEWVAELADMRSAWRHSPLTETQRRRLCAHYGAGDTQRQIAAREGVTGQAVSASIESGLAVLHVDLNARRDQ